MKGDPRVRVWCIGREKTEFYAAHSEDEMRQFYTEMVGEKQAKADFEAYFCEVPEAELDVEFDLGDNGRKIRTTWRKQASLYDVLPAQISSGQN